MEALLSALKPSPTHDAPRRRKSVSVRETDDPPQSMSMSRCSSTNESDGPHGRHWSSRRFERMSRSTISTSVAIEVAADPDGEFHRSALQSALRKFRLSHGYYDDEPEPEPEPDIVYKRRSQSAKWMESSRISLRDLVKQAKEAKEAQEAEQRALEEAAAAARAEEEARLAEEEAIRAAEAAAEEEAAARRAAEAARRAEEEEARVAAQRARREAEEALEAARREAEQRAQEEAEEEAEEAARVAAEEARRIAKGTAFLVKTQRRVAPEGGAMVAMEGGQPGNEPAAGVTKEEEVVEADSEQQMQDGGAVGDVPPAKPRRSRRAPVRQQEGESTPSPPTAPRPPSQPPLTLNRSRSRGGSRDSGVQGHHSSGQHAMSSASGEGLSMLPLQDGDLDECAVTGEAGAALLHHASTMPTPLPPFEDESEDPLTPGSGQVMRSCTADFDVPSSQRSTAVQLSEQYSDAELYRPAQDKHATAAAAGSSQHFRSADLGSTTALPPLHKTPAAGGTSGTDGATAESKQHRSSPNLTMPDVSGMVTASPKGSPFKRGSAPQPATSSSSTSSPLQLPPIARNSKSTSGATPPPRAMDSPAPAGDSEASSAFNSSGASAADADAARQRGFSEDAQPRSPGGRVGGLVKRQISFADMMRANGSRASSGGSSVRVSAAGMRRSLAGPDPRQQQPPPPMRQSLAGLAGQGEDSASSLPQLVSPKKPTASYDDIILHYSRTAQAWVKEVLPGARPVTGRTSALGGACERVATARLSALGRGT